MTHSATTIYFGAQSFFNSIPPGYLTGTFILRYFRRAPIDPDAPSWPDFISLQIGRAQTDVSICDVLIIMAIIIWITGEKVSEC